MNRLKNTKITLKIVLLVLFLQFATIALFSYFDDRNEELRERKNMDEKLRIVAYAVNDFVLQEYHDRILDENSITNEEYMDLMIRLSSFAQKANVKYISSMVKRKGKVLFTSTSATDEDFKAKNYELFFESYADASDQLKDSFENKQIFHEETVAKYGYLRTIFIPFMNKYGETYVVGIDIEVTDLAAIYSKNREQTLVLAGIIFLISAMISAFLIHLLLKRIVVIRNALQEFFDFLNRKSTIISPIDVKSGDELGEMGRLINDNVKAIAANIDRDNELIYEIASISEQVKMGVFTSRIETEADNPALNDVKNIMNDVLVNMQSVMLDILNVLKEYSKQNYRSKLDEYTFDGEMGKLVVEMNIFSKNISDYMLNTAYDAINLDKDSSFLNEYMASLTEKFKLHLKELHALTEVMAETRRFNAKSLENTLELEKQKSYAQDLLSQLQVKVKSVFAQELPLTQRERAEALLSTGEMMDDISHSLELIDKSRAELYRFLEQTANLMLKLSEGFESYEHKINEGIQSVDQTQKVSNNLKELSQRMRKYIEKSDFTGKENINILMNYTDR